MSGRREQFAEHLKFFAELGVTGYRKDSLWSTRPESAADLKVSTTNAAMSPANAGDAVDRSADLQVGPRPTSHGPAPTSQSLESIREDIGECVRCKLCSLGRKQIVFGVGNPD